MKRGLLVGTGLVLVAGVVTPAVPPMGVDAASVASRAAMPFDFDGDGFADLAVGVRSEDLRGKRDAGVVQVLYGSPAGPTDRDQLWHQGRKGVKGAVEHRDNFGSPLASGDFDTDGFADLAVGIPGENVGGVRDAGSVQVLYGSRRGLTARDQVWHQGTPGVPGVNEVHDEFGSSLAAGDFDGDGFWDLVIGAPFEDLGAATNAGYAVVLRGSPVGLTSRGVIGLRPGGPRVSSPLRESGFFGARLVTGDANGDGVVDLVVDMQTDPGSEAKAAHEVELLLGGTAGLTSTGGQHFGLASLGMEPAFIGGLTMSDFNRDGRDDLVLSSGQRVAVLHGHPDGFHPAPLPPAASPGVDAVWSMPYATVAEDVVRMASGDFTGDGNPDLAVETAGPVAVILGTASGLGAMIGQWSVDARYAHLTVLALSGGSHPWLVVGRQGDAVGSSEHAGTVTVLQGTPAGAAGPITVWSQDSPGIKGKAEQGDSFGSHLGDEGAS